MTYGSQSAWDNACPDDDEREEARRISRFRLGPDFDSYEDYLAHQRELQAKLDSLNKVRQ